MNVNDLHGLALLLVPTVFPSGGLPLSGSIGAKKWRKAAALGDGHRQPASKLRTVKDER